LISIVGVLRVVDLISTGEMLLAVLLILILHSLGYIYAEMVEGRLK